jgi:hypothetical protein
VHAADSELVARAGLRFLYAPTPAEADFLGRLKIVSDVGGHARSITGAAEWDLGATTSANLPDGSVPMWRPGFQVLRARAATPGTRRRTAVDRPQRDLR